MHLNNFLKCLSTSKFLPSLGIQAMLFVKSFYGLWSLRPLLRSYLGLTSERWKNGFKKCDQFYGITGNCPQVMKYGLNRCPKTVYRRHLFPPCSKVTFFVHQGFLTNSLCLIFVAHFFLHLCKMGTLK